MVGEVLVSSLFRLSLPVSSLISTVTSPFPLSLVPSFLLFPFSELDSRYGGPAGIPSGVSVGCYFLSPDMMFLIIYSKSRLVIKRVPDPSQDGVIPVSFLLFRQPAAGLA